MTSPSSAAAFDALAIVVRDRGLDIADDPSRLRGMLNDVLAADARVNRAAVDALVLAAEQGVPRELSSTPVPDEARLVARLTGRGVSPELAGQTVRAWIVAAQGGRTAPAPAAPTQPPPGALPAPPPPPPPTALPKPPAAPVGPTVVPLAGATVLPTGEPTFESTSPSADEAAIATGARPAIAPVLVPPPPPGPPAGAKGEGRVPRKTIVILIAAVVAAVALIGAVLALGGGDDDDTATPTTLPSTTSTSTTTTVPGEPLLEVLAPAAGTEATGANTELSGRVEPGSSVTVDGTAVAVDAAGNWKQPVALPGAENTFSIVVTTPTGTTKTVAWIVKRDVVAPVLDITDPVDGAVFNTREVLLHGTTERNATVTVDGVGAAPDTATTTDTVFGWVSGVLINGDQQTYTVTSTDPAGNVQTKTVTLRFQSSAPPPSPTTTPRPKPPTTPTTTTAPPPPASTLVAGNDSGGTYNFLDGGEFSVNVLGNDTYAGYTDIEYSGLNPGYGSLSRASGGFFVYTMRQNGTYTETFQYRLRNANTGEVSNWATVTINILAS